MKEQDLLLIKRAKGYLKLLGNSIDPITNTVIEDSAVCHPKTSRCLLYVADILEELLQNNDPLSSHIVNPPSPPPKEKSPKGKKVYPITKEDIAALVPKGENLSITEFTAVLNTYFYQKYHIKLSSSAMLHWLVEHELLDEVPTTGNRTKRILNAYSSQIGISSGTYVGHSGPYTIILYSTEAQQFLIDNLEEIYGGYTEE